MRLTHVCVEGYRSIREPMNVPIDSSITVILGANDHGKSNLLESLLHLNPDKSFDPETDVNWDCEGQEDKFPQVRFTLVLSDEEREELLRAANAAARVSASRTILDDLDRAAQGAANSAAEARRQADEFVATDNEAEGAADSLGDDAAEGTPDDLQLNPDERLRKSADDAESAAALAQRQADLAYGDYLAAVAAAEGDQDFDLDQRAAESQSRLAQIAADAEQQSALAAQAQQLLEQAQAQSPDSPDVAAEQAAASAAESARQASEAAARLEEEAARLQSAINARALKEARHFDYPTGISAPSADSLTASDVPAELVLSRVGLEGELLPENVGGLAPEAAARFLLGNLPRVELIKPQDQPPDEVTPGSIHDLDNDFMRGIFRYADLDPTEWDSIFAQNDTTTKRLGEASKILNETLRASWSQGQDIEFSLDHHEGKIDLRINDQAVQRRTVRVSRRSSGFTAFFALQTTLYAREKASTARSFIWLFDEPGMYLHPAGQHDLMQILERLSLSNQIIYATHSLFMINKNYPTRHRLLTKGNTGTCVDQKPYAGQWRAAIDALGLAFPGTALFASKVLLVEGDSDPILLYADFQKLIQLGKLEVDLNPVAFIGTGNSKHADALTRILLESAIRPRIALLFDGDKGGLGRRKNLKSIVDANKLPCHELDKGTTIEDHLLAPDLFVEAAVRHVSKRNGDIDTDLLRQSIAEKRGSGNGLAAAVREACAQATDEDDPPSPVGIAREYGSLLQDAALEPDSVSIEPGLALARKIAEMLELEARVATVATRTDIVEPDF